MKIRICVKSLPFSLVFLACGGVCFFVTAKKKKEKNPATGNILSRADFAAHGSRQRGERVIDKTEERLLILISRRNVNPETRFGRSMEPRPLDKKKTPPGDPFS